MFHILLFVAFILADIDMKGNVKNEEIIIEFPDILPDFNESIIEHEQSDEQVDNMANNENNLSNVASNRSAIENTTTSAEEFFDKEYLKEIEAAKKLVSDVTNQLSKEVVDMDDIKMPVETTEGMNPDSIKNIVYAGESNIIYYLENRYHISLPIPVYLAQGGGKIIVDIEVNQQGIVTKATTRPNRSIKDEQIFLYAQASAKRTIFNSDYSAPATQKGTIHYTFISQ